MATKKQKREAALAKREAYMNEVKASGLAAQKKDQEERAERAKIMAEVVKENAERLEKILQRNPQLKSREPKPKAARRPRGIVPQVIIVDEVTHNVEEGKPWPTQATGITFREP